MVDIREGMYLIEYRSYLREIEVHIMKKLTKIGIFIVLVTGMVLMSGCVNSDSTGTEPVSPTISQTVRTTVPVTPTPSPEITVPETTIIPTTIPNKVTRPPVSIPSTGVWVKITYSGNFSGSLGTPGVLKFVEGSGDQLYQVSTIDGPVVVTIQKSDGSTSALSVDVYKDGAIRQHDATTSPRGIIEIQTSVKTVTIPITAVPVQNNNVNTESTTLPLPTSYSEDMTTGSLYIHIRAGNVGPDLKAFIARDGTSVGPVIYYSLPDKTVVEGQNMGYYIAKILVDGNSEVVNLIPGSYTAYLPDMKGGEPEIQSFIIQSGARTDIWFSGYSVAASSRGCS